MPANLRCYISGKPITGDFYLVSMQAESDRVFLVLPDFIDRLLDEPAAKVLVTQNSDFKPWDGGYEKQFYDVQLSSGVIIEHCWPNAGVMTPMDGSRSSWTPEDKINVRVSRRQGP